MALKIFNTLSKTAETFKPINPGKVGMYLCGVTVYDDCHLGHGRTFVAFDAIRRWLEASGYDVNFVRNVTDVDDKIIKRSAELGVLPEELSQKYTQRMQEDFEALGCLKPTAEPRATQYIPQMLSLIDKLEEKGYAYQDASGDVDFSVRKFKPYGLLSGKRIDELRSGERVAVDETKQDPLDFVLWKRAKPGEPQWDSKWGKGRPGWHIECSAMSCNLLGETFDIHGGGPDLMFPHHENEIAQSEAASGKKFVNTWMHSGSLLVNGEKMSKSKGNFITIRDALADTNKKYGEENGAETVRFFLLKSHYKSKVDYTPTVIDDAYAGLYRLYGALKEVPPDEGELDWNEPYAQRFKEAMDNDFNTALAVSVLYELSKEVNTTKSPALARQLKKLGATLGLLQLDPEKFIKGAVSDIDEAWVVSKIEERKQAKKDKDFKKADAIRAELKGKGIILE
ncbi:MAG: cysteine--tRNA ligase, partial [Burkholderiales bacterium]|nr:cysteine--tRNA ligase [Burkholderiales bacterium]